MLKRASLNRSTADGKGIKSFSVRLRSVCCGVLVLLCAATAYTQNGPPATTHTHGKHSERAVEEATPTASTRRFAIPDVEVLDQNGQKRKFYSDLIKGRIVIINFVYTSCTSYCPMSAKNFASLQALLGDRLGKDIQLLSVSTDPEIDTPAKLKTWSERFKPQAGWTFITGDKEAMGTLLTAMTGEGPRRGYHVPIALVINDENGAWNRTYGLESPARLIKRAEDLSAQPAREQG